jgi:glycosyltransferase involved in cell wall biosynthesis
VKILFIVEHYYPYIGGAEILWKELSESLVKNGDEVTVVTTRFDKKLPPRESIRGVEVIRLNISSRYGFTFLSVPACIRYARRADIIQTSSYNSALPAWIASKWTSTPAVITFHEVWGKLWFKLPFTPRLSLLAYFSFEWFLLKLNFDRFVGVSDFTAGRLRDSGVRSHRVVRIYNGLNYDEFKGYTHSPPEVYTFCYFGRLGISKGLDHLIEGFSLLSKESPGVRLNMIVPTQPDRLLHRLKKMAERLGVQNNIKWKHELSRDQLFLVITQSHAVVIPSLSEGFCFAATEAVALGTPVISSNKGALQEVVGGKYIVIDPLNPIGVHLALSKSMNKRWEEKPRLLFQLADTTSKYIELYKTLLKY